MEFAHASEHSALFHRAPRMLAASAPGSEKAGTASPSGQEVGGETPGATDSIDPPLTCGASFHPRHAFLRQTPLALALPGPTVGYSFWMAVIVLGAAAYLYLAHREKKLAEASPDPLADKGALENALALSVDQHSLYRLTPHLPSQTSHGGESPAIGAWVCVHLDRSRLVLADLQAGRQRTGLFPTLPPAPKPAVPQTPGIQTSGQESSVPEAPAEQRTGAGISAEALAARFSLQPGRSVTADFCIMAAGAARTFRFDSMLLRILPDGLLELARPARLERWRRRTFDRITPPRADILALGVWPWEPTTSTEGPEDTERSKRLPSTPDQLPPPLLVFHPGKVETLRLADISPSGVGLRVRQRTLAAALAASKEGRQKRARLRGCLLFLSLKEQNGPPLVLWLACARRHATACATRPSSLVMGFQIVQWAETADAASPINWKLPASGGEAPPLLRWTLRRQAHGRRTCRFPL